MKTLKTLSVLAFLLCCSVYSNAQLLCGVDANFNATIASNTVYVNDSSFVSANWQIFSWHWSWGDGTSPATTQNAVHTYAIPGTYQICLRVEAGGMGVVCMDSVCHTITVSGCNTIGGNFTHTVSGATATFTSQFSSNYPPLSYEWHFGDSTAPSTAQNPVHTYASSGTYTVCVTVTDATGCSRTECHLVQVGSSPCAGVHASFTATNNGLGVVVLQSTSVGVSTGTLYQWWMDGTSLTNPNPNTAFTLSNVSAGHHTFCLYVYQNNSTNFCDSSCQTIYVSGPCQGITANWNFAVLANDSVRFEAADTNSLANHYWDFGDGTTDTGTHLIHHYSVPGTYNVCFYVYIPGTNCVDSLCRTITVTNSGPCGNLSANWTHTYSSGGSVNFFGTNSTMFATHHWNFGDGNISTLPNPTHCYSAGGLYTVCHIVTIPGTICADTNCHAIQATACNPCAGFNVSITSHSSSLGGFEVRANITGGIPGTPVAFTWNTGDTGQVIRVIQQGVYCVTATDASGCTAAVCDSVGGNTPCNINVTIIPQSSGGVYVLTAQANGGTAPYTFTWTNGATGNVITVNAPGTYCVIAHDANQCVGDACFTVPGTIGTDTICGVIFEDTNGNGIMDSTEQGIPNALVYAGNYSTRTDSSGHYMLIVPSGVYSIIYCAPTGYTYTIPLSSMNNGLACRGYMHVTISGGGMHCGFNFGIQNNSVSVCGTVYLDANNNQTQDSTENGIPNVHIEIVSSTGHVYHAYTDAHGHYCVLLPVGTYTIHAASSLFNTCPITPNSITVTATTPGQVLGGNNFAAYCQPGLCNLRVAITPHTTITAGFPAWYGIRVCNIGSSVSGGTLNMFYDDALTFDHSSPAPASHNSSTQTLTWNVNNLLPGNCSYYWVVFDADTNITIGQFVFTLVNITPDANCNDVNMANNVDTVHQAVTASWDPNNKFAYTTNNETNPAYQWVSSINADQRMEYVINFQNLGNAPAVNVVVKDIISSDLDINSFELLGTSHEGIVTGDGSELNFKFSGIMLAPATVDEPNSHGWVAFAINSVNGLPGGHVITDEADIYFDYNQPVTTNDAAVIMLDATGIEEVPAQVTVVVAPNPMSRFAEIRLNNSQAEKFLFRVTDLAGRVVAEETSTGSSLFFERNTLASGMYAYQVIQNSRAVAKGKLVVE